MEQRPLRLGDIVDDYCPRERRITNHAIVALVEETVKQTRCTTCDHEHVFKGAKEPRRRKKDQTSALFSQVLSGLQKTHTVIDEVADDMNDDEVETQDAPAPDPVLVAPRAEVVVEATVAVVPAPVAVIAEAEAQAAAEAEGDDDSAGNVAQDDEPWPMHRRLIRAQLPRTGNEPPPARPIPEFTVRQPGSRGGQQRQWGRNAGTGNGGNGNAPRGGQGHGGGQRPPGRGGRFVPQGPRSEGRGGGGQNRSGGRGRRSR